MHGVRIHLYGWIFVPQSLIKVVIPGRPDGIMAMSVTSQCTDNGGYPYIVLEEPNDSIGQQFYIQGDRIMSVKCSGMSMHIHGGGCDNGKRITLRSESHSIPNTQRWIFNDGELVESKACPGKGMGIYMDTSADGGRVKDDIVLWQSNGNWNELWEEQELSRADTPSTSRGITTYGQAIVDLFSEFGVKKGITWDISTNAVASSDWIVQHPPAEYSGQSSSMLPVAETCDSGDDCDTEFHLKKCTEDSDCKRKEFCQVQQDTGKPDTIIYLNFESFQFKLTVPFVQMPCSLQDLFGIARTIHQNLAISKQECVNY